MSLFTSLYTGVSGMNAQSQSTANISNNIANMTTIGFKKADTVFRDLVVNNTKPARFANGGVMTDRIQRIDIQGPMQQAVSNTEIAIAGQGFFAVKTQPSADLEMLYTRNGAFSQDKDGLLRNSAGFVLYGWPADSDGVPMTGTDLSSLVPVDIDTLNADPIPTTRAEQVLILDASEEPYDPHVFGSNLPVTNQDAHFIRSQTVYDSLGNQRTLNFEYRKVVGPMAHFTSNAGSVMTMTDSIVSPSGPTPGIASGDTLVINGTSGSATVTFVSPPANTGLGQASTVGEAIQVINSALDGGGNRLFYASLTESGRLLVRAANQTDSIDISASSASVTGLSGFSFLDDPATPGALTYDPEASLTANGAANPNQTDFPAFADTAAANPFGWWEVAVTMADPADPSNAALPAVELSKGLINFNGDGSLNAQVDGNGESILSLNNIEFDNALAGEEISVAVDIAGYGQFSSNYTAIKFSNNGAAPGTLNNVVIDDLGHVIGKFTNGTSRILYQLAIVDFVNPNGLKEHSGTVFSQTQDSGDFALNAPGTEGSGLILPSTIENSNVDLADEFANLIVSQRAFSANSRVVNTVDEMTQQLRQLKS